MSVRDIEFIRTVDIKVKEEDVLKLGKSDNEDAASASIPDAFYLRTNKTRYGEIFMFDPDRLLLICSFCDEVHGSMQQFGEHIRGKHLDRNVGSEKDMFGVKIEEPQVNIKDPPAVEEVLELVDKGEFESSHEDAASSKAENDGERCEESSSQDSDSDNEPLTEKVKKARKLKTMKARKPTDSDSDYEPTTKKAVRGTQPERRKGPVTKEDLFCRRCNRQYKNLATFNVHLKNMHENRKTTLQCIYCDKEFSTEEELGDHKGTHDRIRPFQCPYCPKSFPCRFNRECHINSHLGALPHKCSKCPKAYRTEVALRQHILSKHALENAADTVANPICCEICGKLFIQQSLKDIHMRWHTGESPYQCELCGRKFRLGGLLTEHMKRHNNERNYECKVCGKKFYTTPMLNRHQVVHSTEKPFECEDCGKTFSRRLTLKLHRKIHSDVYQYSCNICGKQFKQSSGLYSHKKTHGIGNRCMSDF